MIYLFTYGLTGSLLLCVAHLQLQSVGATLCCGESSSYFCGFSCCGAWAPGV